MAEATCLNEDCEKDQWTLTKHPDDYARGGPSCPDCGSSRVEVHMSEGEQGEPSRAPARSKRQDTQEVARQGNAPQGGAAVAETAIALLDDDVPTEKRAEAAERGGVALGQAVGRLFRYQQQKKQARRQRAASADLQKDDAFQECVDCGYTFSEVNLDASSIECPDCGAVYHIVD